MRKIKILGWVLLPLNIIGLSFCVYSLQAQFNIPYLIGTGFFVSQFIYIAKTLEILKQIRTAREKLEFVVKNAGLGMVKTKKRKKDEE